MEKITIQPDKESIKTIELELGQSLIIKLAGEKKTHTMQFEPEAIKVICVWIGDNNNSLEKSLNYLASAACFFIDKAIEEKIEDQYDYFANIQAIAMIHRDLIKFLS